MHPALKKTLRHDNDVIGLDRDVVDLFPGIRDGIHLYFDDLFNALFHADNTGAIVWGTLLK